MDEPREEDLASAATPPQAPPGTTRPAGRRTTLPPLAESAPELHFQAGGVVQRSSFYVSRRADDDLYIALLGGEFCSVLGPRHSGKSSLRVRTQERLEGHGVRCASVGLHDLGTQLSEEQWYFTLSGLLSRRLGLSDPAEAWRREGAFPPVLRFQHVLRSVLSGVRGKLVIFLDEIETALSLPFPRSDFFAALRGLYNRRVEEPEYRRLSLCLLGAATPLELCSDPQHTPFNIGQQLTLSDFNHEEAGAFLPGLRGLRGNGQLWLDEVLEWTSGHPALTQCLCQALSAQQDLQREPGEPSSLPGDVDEKAQIEALVHQLFLQQAQGGSPSDPVLLDIERRFHKESPRAAVMLALYRRLLERGSLEIIPDNETQLYLRVVGLLTERRDREGPVLKVRNRIFGSVFNESWLKRHEDQRFLSARLHTWHERKSHPYFVLQGEELAEAVRWARDRDDVTAEEREFLLASEEAALATERRKQEEEQVQQALHLSQERHKHRRRLAIMMGVAGLILLVLLSTIGWLYLERKNARAERQKAQDDRVLALQELASTRNALGREKDDHRRTQAQRQEAQTHVATMERERESIKHDLGLKEVALSEIVGKQDRLFKKRVPGSSASTGVSKEVVDGVLLKRAWPSIRGCYPVSGPVPQELALTLTIVPAGQITEAFTNAAAAQKDCVLNAVRTQRFPPFVGAYFVKIDYRYRKNDHKR